MNIRAKIIRGVADEPLLRAKQPRGARADSLDGVIVRREAHRSSNSRGDDRHRLIGEGARITYDGREIEVELINLSGGGAMVAGRFVPMIWDRVDLHLGPNGTIECAVRWVRDGRVGLEFAHETRLDWSSDEVAALLRQVIERTFPDIAFREQAEEPPVAAEEKPAPRMRWDDEQRTAPRHPLIWNGTLYHDFQTTPVRIRNISSSGAMIETDAAVRVGSQPLLELTEATSLSATVEWAVGDQVGLSFHTPFDMNMLAESTPSVVKDKWAPPAYLDPDAESEGAKWDRLSLYQLQQELEGYLKR
jgi:hypothetical protein